jgi:hypothetical protein
MFRLYVESERSEKGDFSFHPSDANLSPGIPERKKTLEGSNSLYTYSENALAVKIRGMDTN